MLIFNFLKLALLIEYDGTDFAGWQTQRDHPKGRSVQGEIERGLHQLFARHITVHGAGRTDAGVHARGMVAHIEFPDEIPITLQKLLMAINATTPEDIAIRDLRPVTEDFHARHSALAREYRYTIKRERTAIDRNFVWAVRRDVEFEKLERSASLLIGEHDFTSFSKRTSDVKHYRCIVASARWEFHGTTFALTLRANRFVRGMVRALVGAMVRVGQGTLSIDEFETLLREPRELWRAKYIAPAHGLVLEGVEYPERFGLWRIGEVLAR
ncbi:MAG TPA: tRNA pseudouridine(38-40) synthase TruA [Candidatus Kapabacteria bacterium]|nr:tRNA pseudouridine(38-40) synthase TruA [Candidatus Kapabacteria bacterium]